MTAISKFDIAYLKMAREWAKLSYCKRKQVGAIVVKDRMIISDGYNGTPSGFENCCEDQQGATQWHVLHAEANAILKLARSTQSSDGATLYITLSPCKECSKLVLQAGIKRVVYIDEYSDTTGIELLSQSGIICQQIAQDILDQS
jgi:dCMP deaminase